MLQKVLAFILLATFGIVSLNLGKSSTDDSDRGPMIEPNGLTADSGPMIDPDGSDRGGLIEPNGR
jgi:hypothetical protein